jgi:hypothetical protein
MGVAALAAAMAASTMAAGKRFFEDQRFMIFTSFCCAIQWGGGR